MLFTQTAYVCSTIPYPRSHLIHSLYYFTFLNYMQSAKIDFRAVLIKGIDKDFILRYILPVFFWRYSSVGRANGSYPLGHRFKPYCR